MIKTKKDLHYYKSQDAVANGFVSSGTLGVKRFIKKRLSRQYKFLVLLRELEYCHNNPNVLNKAIYFF